MSNEDEHFADRLRAAWPAPKPSVGFDAALERRLAAPRPRPVWAYALALGGAAVAAFLLLREPLVIEVPALPAVASLATPDDAFYAALDLEAEEEEWLPEDYAGLAEVLDL